jgi:hypothetical protein
MAVKVRSVRLKEIGDFDSKVRELLADTPEPTAHKEKRHED